MAQSPFFLHDVSANGFSPDATDIFLQFRNQFNENQLGGAQLSINQTNSIVAGFLTDLGSTNEPVSVSIPLSEFSGVPSDLSGLATSDRIQFQYFTRSSDGNYSADAGNVLVLDNIGITLATAIPEPASATLVVVGALCIATRRRRGA